MRKFKICSRYGQLRLILHQLLQSATAAKNQLLLNSCYSMLYISLDIRHLQ